jgi:hypothetical protein
VRLVGDIRGGYKAVADAVHAYGAHGPGQRASIRTALRAEVGGVRVFLCFVLVLASCGDGRRGAIQRDGGGNDSCISPCGSSSDPGGPRILSLTTNTPVIAPGDRWIVTAVVTDPDGIDDLIGGMLEAPGGGTYGSFATSAAEGSYSLELDFDDLDVVERVATPIGGSERAFVARFYDVGGREATREIGVRIACDDPNVGVCRSSCVDLSSDVENCGACASGCDPSGLMPRCMNGGCPIPALSGGTSCNEICAQHGRRCDVGTALDDSYGACVGSPACLLQTRTPIGCAAAIGDAAALCLCAP